MFIYTKLTFNEYFWYDVLAGIDLDINWDQISRAADGMISNHGKDALAEAERRAQTLRFAGCYSAVAWESICEVIQDRIGRYTRSECTIAPKLSQPDKLRGVEATWEGFFPFR